MSTVLLRSSSFDHTPQNPQQNDINVSSPDYRCDSIAHYLNNRIDGDVFRLAHCAGEQLDFAFLDLLSDRDSIWDANQISIVELHTGALVAIVNQHFTASVIQ